MQRGVSGLWCSGRFSVRRRTRPISSTVKVEKPVVTPGRLQAPGEPGLHDLAALVPRERIDHGNPAGHLVVGQPRQEEGAQVIAGRVVAQDHPGRHVLAQDGVRHARHGGLGHGRVLEERSFHFAGHHVVAAPDDDLLLAGRRSRGGRRCRRSRGRRSAATRRPACPSCPHRAGRGPRGRPCRAGPPMVTSPISPVAERGTVGAGDTDLDAGQRDARPIPDVVRRRPSAWQSPRRTRSCRSRTGPRAAGRPAPKRRSVAAAMGALPTVTTARLERSADLEAGRGDDELHHRRHEEGRDGTVALDAVDPALGAEAREEPPAQARRAAGR